MYLPPLTRFLKYGPKLIIIDKTLGFGVCILQIQFSISPIFKNTKHSVESLENFSNIGTNSYTSNGKMSFGVHKKWSRSVFFCKTDVRMKYPLPP